MSELLWGVGIGSAAVGVVAGLVTLCVMRRGRKAKRAEIDIVFRHAGSAHRWHGDVINKGAPQQQQREKQRDG